MAQPETVEIILEARGLSRHFGGLLAVNEVSFAVRTGEIFGLIGPNGAGKTTLFNLITGLTPPSAGALIFAGKTLLGQRPHQIAQRGIARTFQNIRLFGGLSAFENVMIARHLHIRTGALAGMLGLPSARREEREARERALGLLAMVGLAERAGTQARSLPYGDQRRLEIARALALEPKLLLLDEPTAGMTPSEKHGLSAFIRDLRDRLGLTVLLIEHHVPLVMGLCDRVAVLHFGQLIALGDPAQVRSDPAVVEAYLGDE
ncbi:MAG: ABC transporter ATP-binding protein [Chloroflexales bacterium]|nr:ABC transporter ATP-binding protein [Chloroflexales bacterium]